MIAVVPPAQVEATREALRAQGVESWVVGEVVTSEGQERVALV